MYNWNHICCSVDALNNTVGFYLNGYAQVSEIRTPPGQQNPLGSYEVDNIAVGSSNYHGDIADVNLWSHNLSADECYNWTTCQDTSTGNVFNWLLATDLVRSEMLAEYTDEASSCMTKTLGLFLMNETKTYKDADLTCKSIGGHVGFPSAENRAKSSMFVERSGTFWAGYTDIEEEGMFVNFRNDAFNASYWHQGEPNGERIENCVAIFMPSMQSTDTECNVRRNYYCWFEKLHEFRLRGLPTEALVDDTYFWVEETGVWKGIHRSEISENQKHGLGITVNKQLIYLLPEMAMPLGKKPWKEVSTNRSILLSLDMCNATQFNCDNGICINIEQRCDKIFDCPDNSDEDFCETVSFPADYKTSEIPVLRSKQKRDEPLNLYIIYFSLRLVDLKEAESKLYIQFGMYTKWRDNRLKYYNLEMNSNNSVSGIEAKKMWVPEYTVFMLTEDGLVEDKGSRNIVLFPEKAGHPTGTEYVNKSMMFDGADVDIISRNWYSATVVCDLADLPWYPFDTNECKFQIALHGTPSAWDYSMPDVSLKQHFHLKFAPKQFGAYHINTVHSEATSSCRLKITIELKRRFFSVFIKDSLPSILLSIIVYLSNIFYLQLFETAIAVNVTCLLAISGFFIAVFANITETSFVKIMDILQIKCVLIVTLVTLSQIFFVYQQRNGAPSKKVESVRRLFEWMLPALGLAIDAVYIIYGSLHDVNLQ